MQIWESVRIALRALTANKMRSILTMLGIIIGVGAVIALLSVGHGFEQYITQQFEGLGSNLLFVISGQLENSGAGSARVGQQRFQPLTMGDAEALADPFQVPDIMAVAPEYQRSGTVVRSKLNMGTSISGVTPEYESVRNFKPVLGEFIAQEHVNGRSRVAVIGDTVAQELFEEYEYPIGQTIKLNDVPFKVIGVLEEKGGGGFGDEDNVVMIPISTAQTRLFSAGAVRGELIISIVFIQVVSQEKMTDVADRITEVLRERHRISFKDDDDFTVVNQADLIQVFGQFTAVFTTVLGAIAGISLLVGGIGIMNIMLVSVTERTREIGIRKAVGAKRSDILLQFLIEAMVLSMLGGFVGIMLGYGASMLLSGVLDLQTVVTVSAILLATSFSAGVGLFFGIYPATRAARLNPIDALRYE
jgi:putative ABC transport system permease protein